MINRIEPALTPEEWEVPHAPRATFYGCVDHQAGNLTLADGTPNPRTGFGVDVEDIPALIALANATLPDSDPRKITREKIRALRQTVSEVEGEGWDASTTSELADALESYLPPK